MEKQKPESKFDYLRAHIRKQDEIIKGYSELIKEKDKLIDAYRDMLNLTGPNRAFIDL